MKPRNTTQDITEAFLTTGQVAAYCGVNFRTVIRWIKKGYLEAIRLPGRGDHRIHSSTLLEFLKKNDMPIPHLTTRANNPPTEVQKKPQHTTHANRILIVEDDVSFAHSLQRILKSEGYETLIAQDGFHAGYLPTEFNPFLMTLDINMTGMDGIEVLKTVNNTPALQQIKVLVISGDVTGRTEEALQLGAHGVLAKPFQRSDLLHLIKKITHDSNSAHKQKEQEST